MRAHPDACPGAVDLHQAADGGLARVRVPGGTLSAAQFDVLREAALELGDGWLELTSRANVQIRGLDSGLELSGRLRAAGLLPSDTHERIRNIVAAPLEDNQALVDEIDRAICADPALADLPGRFLVTVGAAVSGLGADIGLVGDALLLAGHDSGLRVTDPVAAVVEAARIFGSIRGSAWRLSEVDDGVRKITNTLGVPGDERIDVGVMPAIPGPTVAGVPLGRLDARLLAGTPVRLTPWRSLVVPPGTDTTGLFTTPGSPWHGVSACTGKPGCAKSLTDVRADVRAWLGTPHSRPVPGGLVHWSGCARRCGRPAGQVIEFVATGDGYEEIR